MLNRKTWVLYLFAYPAAGLSLCLDQDKQLEIAHAEIYCRDIHKIGIGYNTPNADVPVAGTFVEMSNLLDLTAEDNVRKRPFMLRLTSPQTD